jgi:hypothetical protein
MEKNENGKNYFALPIINFPISPRNKRAKRAENEEKPDFSLLFPVFDFSSVGFSGGF